MLLSPRTFLLAVRAVLTAPFYVAYGALLLARACLRLPRLLAARAAALADEIPCPNGHANSAVGRWSCGACGATYHGWVGECSLCGAGAAWFSCSECGVSVPLPWEDGR